jgi:hypothetical protein
MKRLVYFEITNGLEQIDSYSFYYSDRLEPSNISGQRLTKIGESAFNRTIRDKADRLSLKIGGSVETIEDRAFAYNSNGYKTIQIGGPGEPSQLTSIGANVFELETISKKEYDEIIIYTDDVLKDI